MPTARQRTTAAMFLLLLAVLGAQWMSSVEATHHHSSQHACALCLLAHSPALASEPLALPVPDAAVVWRGIEPDERPGYSVAAPILCPRAPPQ